METIKLDRQGDLGFVKISSIPKNAKLIFKGKSFELATSEVTGNRHLLVENQPDTEFEVYQTPEGFYILNLKGQAAVRHINSAGQQEGHTDIDFNQGVWIEDRQREFDEIEERRVQD